MSDTSFENMDTLAAHLRGELENKKYVLLYANNGTGKTRLSMAFKDIGRDGDIRDTLYFNAYTEDLFTWNNDLEGDTDRELIINRESRFFKGLEELEMDTRIRKFLNRYVDFDFRIDYDNWKIVFSREVKTINSTGEVARETKNHIKVSRGEENIFIWCFFLALVQLSIDEDETYNWVKYIYIDDPISSLDEQNAISVANQLGQMLKDYDGTIKTVISTHHPLFYNVLCNELGKAKKFLLSADKKIRSYVLVGTHKDVPFFQHLALLQDLWRAKESGQIYTHHFNALRGLLEKSSIFHGYDMFSVCISKEDGDAEETLYARLVNILSHGNYSFYDPVEMLPENKEHFEKIIGDLLEFYSFNPELTPETPEEVEAP